MENFSKCSSISLFLGKTCIQNCLFHTNLWPPWLWDNNFGPSVQGGYLMAMNVLGTPGVLGSDTARHRKIASHTNTWWDCTCGYRRNSALLGTQSLRRISPAQAFLNICHHTGLLRAEQPSYGQQRVCTSGQTMILVISVHIWANNHMGHMWHSPTCGALLMCLCHLVWSHLHN